MMNEDDLIDFLKDGPKIGERVFRDKFGTCPRALLNLLADTVLIKYKVKGVVAYKLMEDVFIQDNMLDDLSLDEPNKIDDSFFLTITIEDD